MDNRSTKRVQIEKVSLFDTLPVEILSVIDNWAIRFEYNNKNIHVMNLIIQKNPVLCKPPYTKLKPFHNFDQLSFYDTTRKKWVHIHYKKYRTRFRPNAHLTKNNPA